jgi:hypothetical protein
VRSAGRETFFVAAGTFRTVLKHIVFRKFWYDGPANGPDIFFVTCLPCMLGMAAKTQNKDVEISSNL